MTEVAAVLGDTSQSVSAITPIWRVSAWKNVWRNCLCVRGRLRMSELLTVRDVAVIMKCSEDAVTKIFAKMEGVIDLGRAETRHKRQYRILRIPHAVLEAYLSRKAGRTITVKIPDRPERRRRSESWQNQAILNLAKAAVQNGCSDERIFRLMANRARMLTRVREEYWKENDWSITEEDIEVDELIDQGIL